jgi:hypothetical protein
MTHGVEDEGRAGRANVHVADDRRSVALKCIRAQLAVPVATAVPLVMVPNVNVPPDEAAPAGLANVSVASSVPVAAVLALAGWVPLRTWMDPPASAVRTWSIIVVPPSRRVA